MKRVSKDHMLTTVASYLKRRRYVEAEADMKKDKSIGVAAAVVQMCAESEAMAMNVYSYSGITVDHLAYEQQFHRLVTFVRDAVEPFRTELMHILFPVFISIYMDMLCCGLKSHAHKFHGRHQSIFANLPCYKSTVEIIYGAVTKCEQQDAKTSLQQELSRLRESKYNIAISMKALHYLQQFLKLADNMLVMQVFNSCIAVEVLPDGLSSSSENDGSGADGHPSSPQRLPNHTASSETSSSSLRQHISRVRSLPPTVSGVCLYTFINAYQGLCCASVSGDSRLLCGGFEDSAVRLWSLVPESAGAGAASAGLRPRSADVDISRIHLCGDYVEDIKENEVIRRSYDFKEMVTMRGHSGTVYAMNFTKDSSHLLSASEDMSVRLWDLETFTNVVLYRGHTQPVWALDIGSCGDYFASASRDRTARLWATDRTYPLRTYAGHGQDVDCVKFHPNGNYVATGSLDRTIRLWSTQDGRCVRLMTGHRAGALCVAFSPDGQLLASAGEDRRIKLWDLSSGNLVKDMRGHSDAVYCLSFSSDGSMLASGGLDSSIKVWDVRQGAATENSCSSADASASSDMLATFSAKSNTVHFLRYGKQNVIEAAGAATW